MKTFLLLSVFAVASYSQILGPPVRFRGLAGAPSAALCANVNDTTRAPIVDRTAVPTAVYMCIQTSTGVFAWTDIAGSGGGGGGGANTALSNLASVSINAPLLFQSALSVGSTTAPPQYLHLYGAGTYGSHSFQLTGTPTGHRVVTFPDASITVAGSASALNSGRVPFATTGGLLTDDAGLTYGSSILSLASGGVLRFSTDAGISRGGAGIFQFGTGAAGSTVGTLQSAAVNVRHATNPYLQLSKTNATARDYYVQYNNTGLELAGGSTSQAKIFIADTGPVGIGPANTSPTGTLHVYDATASTGITTVTLRSGAGQNVPMFQMQGATGGTSGAAIGFDAVNGFTLQSAAGSNTWNDASTAASGTVANRYLLGIAAPTLTATNSSVTYTKAATLSIGGAPTASTNVTIGTALALDVAAGNSNFGGQINASGNITSAAAILSPLFTGTAANNSITVQHRGMSTASTFNVSMAIGTNTQTSGANGAVAITPTYNQASGTAANTDLLINRTETAVGSGAQNLIDAQVGGSSKFRVTSAGVGVFSGNLTASNLKRGSGSPESSVTGVVGDVYQRTDGGSSTSLYVKESGSGNTGWIAVGAGGGASTIADLTDTRVTKTDGTHLALSGGRGRCGTTLFSISAIASITLDSGTAGTVHVGADCRNGGAITVARGSALDVSGSGFTESVADDFTATPWIIPIASVPVSSSAFGTVAENRTFVGSNYIEAGTGMQCPLNVDGVQQCGIDGTVLQKATHQSGGALRCASSTGSDTYTCTMTPTLGGYTDGMVVEFEATATANTGAASLNIDTLGAVNIKLCDGSTDPANSDIAVGRQVALRYDGTVFRLPCAGSGSSVNEYISICQNDWDPWNASASTTYYAGAYISGQASNNGLVRFPSPVDGTIVGLTVAAYISTTVGVGSTTDVTIQKAGSDTSVTANISLTSTDTVASGTGSTAVSKGDMLNYKLVLGAYSTSPVGLRMRYCTLIKTN